MARYVSVFEGVTVSAVQDLFSLLTPATCIAIIHKVTITDDSNSTTMQLNARWRRGATVAGSGGSSVTPEPIQARDAAASCTVRANDTTQAGTGTIKTLGRSGFQLVGSGLIWLPTPECQLIIAPSTRIVLALTGAPGSSRTLSGEMIHEEIG